MAINESINRVSSKSQPINPGLGNSSPGLENISSFKSLDSLLDILDPNFKLEDNSERDDPERILDLTTNSRKSSGILEEHKISQERNYVLLNSLVEQPERIGSNFLMKIYHSEEVEFEPVEHENLISQRQEFVLEAARSLIQIKENNSNSMIREDGEEVSFDKALRGIRALGDTSHLPLESTNFGEALINRHEDSILEQSIPNFAKEHNLSTSDVARILLAQREVFVTSDQFQESLFDTL